MILSHRKDEYICKFESGQVAHVKFGNNGAYVDGLFCGSVERFLQTLELYRATENESPQEASLDDIGVPDNDSEGSSGHGEDVDHGMDGAASITEEDGDESSLDKADD